MTNATYTVYTETRDFLNGGTADKNVVTFTDYSTAAAVCRNVSLGLHIISTKLYQNTGANYRCVEKYVKGEEAPFNE